MKSMLSESSRRSSVKSSSTAALNRDVECRGDLVTHQQVGPARRALRAMATRCRSPPESSVG